MSRRFSRTGAVLCVASLALAAAGFVTTGSAAAQPPATPTRSGPSPTFPNPNPPAGGRAPDGQGVGGSQLLTRSVVRAAHSPPQPVNTASAFMVTDLDTGEVLAARDPHGRYQPASVLKLLTSVTLLPKLAGKQIVVASKNAAGGFTDAAQHTFAGAAQRNGRRVGVVLLRARRKPLDQWQQAALLNWAYALPRTTTPVGVLRGTSPKPAPAPSAAPGTSSARTAGLAGGTHSLAARPATGLSATRAEILVVAAVGLGLMALIASGSAAIRRRR